MRTNLYVINVSSEREKEEIKKQLEKFDIISELEKQLPYDCCGRADCCGEIPQNLAYHQKKYIKKNLTLANPWVFAGNTAYFIPICIWHHCGGWCISTDGLWFERGGDVEKYGADYFLSFKDAEKFIREKDGHISFIEINELKSKIWDKFIEASK